MTEDEREAELVLDVLAYDRVETETITVKSATYYGAGKLAFRSALGELSMLKPGHLKKHAGHKIKLIHAGESCYMEFQCEDCGESLLLWANNGFYEQ